MSKFGKWHVGEKYVDGDSGDTFCDVLEENNCTVAYSMAPDHANLLTAAPDFYAACKSGDDPDQDHCDTARIVLDALEAAHDWAADIDPSATSELITETRQFLARLQAAMNKAEGREVTS